ncbi:MAG: hypothetical protein ACE5FJ_08305, partial [Gemmatimonadales bacterium]
EVRHAQRHFDHVDFDSPRSPGPAVQSIRIVPQRQWLTGQQQALSYAPQFSGGTPVEPSTQSN